MLSRRRSAPRARSGGGRRGSRSGHLEGVEDHLGAHVRRHPPADDAAAERVDDEAHIGHARPGRHVGQIGDPQRVRARSAVKLRLTRSGARTASGSARVVNTFRRRGARLRCPAGASAGPPGPGRCRGRPGGPPSRACGPRRPCGWRPTAPSAPASSPRRARPGPTGCALLGRVVRARGHLQRRCRWARPRTRRGWRR